MSSATLVSQLVMAGHSRQRTASLPLAYDPAIHVFIDKKARRGSPGQAR
jgi:hypothetical protein